MGRIRTYACRYCHSNEDVHYRVGIGNMCDTCYEPIISKKKINGVRICLDCGITGGENFSARASLRCFSCAEKAELIRPCVKCGVRTVDTKIIVGYGYHCTPCGEIKQKEIVEKKEALIKKLTKTCKSCNAIATTKEDRKKIFGRNSDICLTCHKGLNEKLKVRKPCFICGTTEAIKFSTKKRYCDDCVDDHVKIDEYNKQKYVDSGSYHRNKEKYKEAYHNDPDKKVRIREQALEWRAKNPIKYKLLQCRGRAKSKGYSFSLTDEYIELLFISQNNRCFYTGDPIDENNFSIDRINSNLGYTKDNIVLCCADANIARNDLTHQEFFELVTKIYKHSVLNGHGVRFL